MRWLIAWGLITAGLVTAGCERAAPCAGRGDMTRSEAGLTVTAGEHGIGWGQQDCALCHPSWSLHAHSCSAVDIDMTDVNERADLSAPETCVPCHGDNGVSQWKEAADTGS